MNKCPVFLSSSTLCGWGIGLPYRMAFALAKRCGFTGIDILLTMRVIKTHRRLIDLADQFGLNIAFHKWWHGPQLSSKVLTALGIFPERGVQLRDVLPANFLWPVVVSSFNWDERNDLPHILVQPACTSYAGSAMPFDEFCEKARFEKTSLVFDVMHWLEYRYSCYGEGMPFSPTRLLLDALGDFAIWKEQIKETHIYDWKNTGPTYGSKWFPGDGVFPVFEFLSSVKRMGWQGRITWEIHPVLMATHPWYVRRLKELPQMVRDVG